MIPKDITHAHVEDAIEALRIGGVPEGRASRKYDLVHGGRRYPPKLVVAMAARAVLGRELTSEEFGGGVETNGFLRGLGFEIVDKPSSAEAGPPPVSTPLATPAPPAPSRPRARTSAVTLDRVWMGMGVARSAFFEMGERWAAHKRIVSGRFTSGTKDYVERIGAIADASTGRFLHLPACALVTGRGIGVLDYRFRRDVTVVAGRYDVDAHRETLVVVRGGVVLEECNDSNVLAMDEGDVGLMVAISSTVGELMNSRAPAQSLRAPWMSGKPVLVLDSGHHPYSSRYLFNTLRCTANGARRRAGAPAVVALSSWRYANAEFTKNWCRPEERVAVSESVALGEDLLDRLEVSLDV